MSGSKKLLKSDKYVGLQQAEVLLCLIINQEWSQVVSQIQITKAILTADSMESNFTLGGGDRGIVGVKKMRDSGGRLCAKNSGKKMMGCL